jgi:hypothetical protein
MTDAKKEWDWFSKDLDLYIYGMMLQLYRPLGLEKQLLLQTLHCNNIRKFIFVSNCTIATNVLMYVKCTIKMNNTRDIVDMWIRTNMLAIDNIFSYYGCYVDKTCGISTHKNNLRYLYITVHNLFLVYCYKLHKISQFFIKKNNIVKGFMHCILPFNMQTKWWVLPETHIYKCKIFGLNRIKIFSLTESTLSVELSRAYIGVNLCTIYFRLITLWWKHLQ